MFGCSREAACWRLEAVGVVVGPGCLGVDVEKDVDEEVDEEGDGVDEQDVGDVGDGVGG